MTSSINKYSTPISWCRFGKTRSSYRSRSPCSFGRSVWLMTPCPQSETARSLCSKVSAVCSLFSMHLVSRWSNCFPQWILRPESRHCSGGTSSLSCCFRFCSNSVSRRTLRTSADVWICCSPWWWRTVRQATRCSLASVYWGPSRIWLSSLSAGLCSFLRRLAHLKQYQDCFCSGTFSSGPFRIQYVLPIILKSQPRKFSYYVVFA